MEEHRLLERCWTSAASARTRRSSLQVAQHVDELLSLEHALSTQIEAIGERCVSLWGKPQSESNRPSHEATMAATITKMESQSAIASNQS